MLIKIMLFALLAWGSGDTGKKNVIMKFSSQDHDGNHVLVENLDGPEKFKVQINGEEFEVDGTALESGESQTILLADGRDFKVRREDSGVILNLDGKDINPGSRVWLADKGAPAMIELLKSHADPDKVRISGLGEIDDATKEKIIAALKDAGIEKEISFGEKSDAYFFQSGDDGQIETKVIRNKEVKVYRFDSKNGDSKVKVETQVNGGPVIVIEEKDVDKEKDQ